MAKLWDDLFESYRRYKWMNVDSPMYEPLENGVMSKEDIKKLKAKEYNEKNKEKQKIKRLEKLVEGLRAENKQLKANNERLSNNQQVTWLLVPDDMEALVNSEKELRAELEQKEKDLAEFKEAVKVIMKFL